MLKHRRDWTHLELSFYHAIYMLHLKLSDLPPVLFSIAIPGL